MRTTSGFRLGTTLAATAVIALALLGASPLSAATGTAPLSGWNIATQPTPVGSWYAVTYGSGQWVALGHGASVAVSPDGSTWTEYPIPAGSWQSVTYGDGQYVALSSVNAGPEEIVSSNGQSWAAAPGPTGPWAALTFGNGRFVAVSSTGQIDTSTNGTQWTSAWDHSNYDFTSVTYGDGHFVATDEAMGAIAISTNGLTWSRLFPTPGVTSKWGAVVYGEGNFAAFNDSSSGSVATSVSASVWATHPLTPTQAIDSAAFGCGSFVGVGQSAGATADFISSTSGSTWVAAAVPTDATSDWTAVAYGAHRFVAVDSTGDIAWTATTANCAAVVPKSPQQVSGNIESGRVWTYMHPPASAGTAPVNSYRVNISNATSTKQCSAPVYFEPNCIIAGLRDHQVYWVTAQSHNRFGYSVPTDPEFVIPVASWTFSATASEPVVSQGTPLVVQVTGVRANSEGIYPNSLITVHVGSRVATCYPNPFGECLITISNPPVGSSMISATYTGYGTSYQSPASHVTVQS